MSSENLESTADEIFEDPLCTPPTTDLETGTWDDSGSIRGFALEKPYEPGNTIYDVVLEEEFESHGLQCILCRITEYHRFGVHTLGDPDYGESATYYWGCVHAPGVDSFPRGYCGTYIVDCYPDDNWYRWSENTWSNGSPRRGSVREWAHGKTDTLARGLAQRQRGEL